MVQRLKQAAKKVSLPREDAMAALASQSPVTAGRKRAANPPQRAKSLEQERDDLKAALTAAQTRIKVLEEAQTQVVNRIGWMVEALQTMKEEGK